MISTLILKSVGFYTMRLSATYSKLASTIWDKASEAMLVMILAFIVPVWFNLALKSIALEFELKLRLLSTVDSTH